VRKKKKKRKNKKNNRKRRTFDFRYFESNRCFYEGKEEVESKKFAIDRG
jgi:hypothetical protein